MCVLIVLKDNHTSTMYYVHLAAHVVIKKNNHENEKVDRLEYSSMRKMILRKKNEL